MIEDSDLKRLNADPDGLVTYEYIANHIDSCLPDMDTLIDIMARVDLTGQFLISAARYLFAIDHVTFALHIERLVDLGIDKDRERRYIGALMEQFYGQDYTTRSAELSAADNNFRRIFKRLYPVSPL